MAILVSEDEEIRTNFELNFFDESFQKREDISWISYKLILKSASKEIVYKRENKDNGAGDYVFALTPVDEVENMIMGVKTFLKDEEKKMYSFEPTEPSFELIFQRDFKGYSVIIWVDAGNVISEHYSWDGFGLRFFTTKEKIENFLNELVKEKEQLCQKEKI